MAHQLFDIAGRTALVTGSSRGIGRALATGLLEAGASVVINARSQDRLDRTTDELAATFGSAVRCLAFDNTDPVAVARAVAEIETSVGADRHSGQQHRRPTPNPVH